MSSIPIFHQIVIMAVPIVLAITLHEVAHGWAASKLGDQTARMLGRLSLNPLKHVDPVGTVLVPILMVVMTPFIFGWAKPVPVDWRNLHKPKRDMAIVGAAGPAANLLMLLGWMLFLSIVLYGGFVGGYPLLLLVEMARVGILINIILMVLNLIPLPPLDGSRIAVAFMSPALAQRYHQLEQWGLIILVLLLFTGVLGRILSPLIGGSERLVYSLLGV